MTKYTEELTICSLPKVKSFDDLRRTLFALLSLVRCQVFVPQKLQPTLLRKGTNKYICSDFEQLSKSYLNNVVDLDLNSVLEMKLVDFDQLSVVDTVDYDQQLDFEIADFDQQPADFVVADAVEMADFDQQPDFVEVAEAVAEIADFDQEGLVVELVVEMLED